MVRYPRNIPSGRPSRSLSGRYKILLWLKQAKSRSSFSSLLESSTFGANITEEFVVSLLLFYSYVLAIDVLDGSDAFPAPRSSGLARSSIVSMQEFGKNITIDGA